MIEDIFQFGNNPRCSIILRVARASGSFSFTTLIINNRVIAQTSIAKILNGGVIKIHFLFSLSPISMAGFLFLILLSKTISPNSTPLVSYVSVLVVFSSFITGTWQHLGVGSATMGLLVFLQLVNKPGFLGICTVQSQPISDKRQPIFNKRQPICDERLW